MGVLPTTRKGRKRAVSGSKRRPAPRTPARKTKAQIDSERLANLEKARKRKKRLANARKREAKRAQGNQ